MATVASHSDIAQFVPDYSTQFLSELQGILEKAQRFSGASGVAIAFVEGTELVTKSGLGASAPEVGSRTPIQGSFTGLSVQTREVQRCDDASCDSRVDSNACASLGIASMVIVPIAEKNKVFGVLAAFAPKPNAFSPTHVALLRTLADIVVELYNRYPAERPQAASEAVSPAMRAAQVQKPEPAPTAAPAQISRPVVSVAAPTAKTPDIAAPKHENAPKPLAMEPLKTKAPVLPPTPIKLTEAPVIVPPAKPELKLEPKVQLTAAPAKSEPLRIERKVDSPRYAPVVDIDAAREKREDVLSSAADIGPSVVTKGAAESTIFSTYSAIGALEQQQREESGSKRILMIAAALVVVVVLAASGYLFSRRSPKAPEVATQTDQSGASASVNPAPTAVQAQATPAPSNTVAPALPVEKAPEHVAEAVKSPAKEKIAEPTAPRKSEPAPLVVANSGAVPKRPAADNVAAPAVVESGTADVGGILGMVKTTQPKAAFRASSVTPPELTKRVAPVYPSFARQWHLKSERVVLNATVAKDGSVSEVKLVRGKQIFVDAAIAAVRQWKYKPAYLNGDPVSASIEIDLDFTN